MLIYSNTFVKNNSFYRPPTKLREGNVFTVVFLFTRGMVSLVPGPCLVPGPMSFRGKVFSGPVFLPGGRYHWSHVSSTGRERVVYPIPLGYLWSHVPARVKVGGCTLPLEYPTPWYTLPQPREQQKRVVRILLECFLVVMLFPNVKFCRREPQHFGLFLIQHPVKSISSV